ncbi:hypothetical protein EJ08DRAFT_661615 [Tothia fuscella]|uniref:DUF7730 domain-containing protein n=1 Tax=Tothia fuscella TaxID=1048955 RepID=A0A9P4NQ87_9PEZI|nr:hypothetical protein EJ08DRAFT_661615 [Tothia fuscella]
MAQVDIELPSRLLNLPIELRLTIWELLLAPKTCKTQILDNKTILTTISRSCSIFYPPPPEATPAARPHDWDDRKCQCHSRSFYRLESNEKLGPTILRVNRQIYNEALPCLYKGRTFITDPNRTFSSLHDRMSDAWFLLDRFFASLSSEARMNVHNIRIPMLLSQFEVYGCREAFYDIAAQLPNLRNTYLDITPGIIRGVETDDSGVVTVHLHGLGHPALDDSEEIGQKDWNFWLGPVLAFSDAAINIVAVDRFDLGPAIFDRVKTALEIRVWKQLLPMRLKRDKRRIARIRKKLLVEEQDLALDGLF